jgi:hypothetical protein
MNRLHAHKILKEPVDNLHSSGLFKKAEDEKYVFSELEYYNWQLAWASIQLRDLMEQLFDAATLLNNYPAKSTGITSFRYLLYTLENWYMRCGSVEDRTINLINRVFHLGCHKAGAADFVLRNIKVERTDVPARFRQLQKVLQEHRTVRNKIVHAESLAPDELRSLAFLYMYDDDMIARHESERFRRSVKRIRAERLSKTRQERKDQLLGINEKIIVALLPLLDVLLPIMNEQHSRLKAYLEA